MKKLKDKAAYVMKSIFAEMTVIEYAAWWLIRLLMIYALFRHEEPMEKVMCAVNTLALFALPLMRLIFSKSSFIYCLPIRCQHIINFMEFLGSFLGSYINIYSRISKFDWIMHLISGPLCVLAGYCIYVAFVKKETGETRVIPSVSVLFSSGFSAIVIVLWEIVEFFGDFLFGTNNQGYTYVPRKNQILFKIFGSGAIADGLQFPLWDTMIDMLYASVTTVAFSIILFAVLKHREKTEANRVISQQPEALVG